MRKRDASTIFDLLALLHVMVSVRTLAVPLLFVMLAVVSLPSGAQGGPPYDTNDPGIPGNLNWEINLGYMPFFYSDQSVSHVPDLDINFGVGDRVQLTYENAWLRVRNPATKFGLGESNFGLKWRFYDAGDSGRPISVFPQLFLDNPNDAVRRGVPPASDAFPLTLSISRFSCTVGRRVVCRDHAGLAHLIGANHL